MAFGSLTRADGSFTTSRKGNKARVLFAMSADRESPTTVDALREALPGVSVQTITGTVANLLSMRAVEKLPSGAFVRLVGEVPEFRG